MYYFKKGILIILMLFSLVSEAQHLQVVGGCRITLTDSVQLVLHNTGLINDGFISPMDNSTVAFTGAKPVTVGGWSPFTLLNVLIEKPAGGTLELTQDIFVIGALSMNTGNILLNNHTINLGSIGSIRGESAASHITGTNGGRVLVTTTINKPVIAFNPGNIGLELTTKQKLGTITIERKHLQETLQDDALSIHRSFTIAGTVTSGLMADIGFLYLDHELAGADENRLEVWTNSNISNSWTPAGSDQNDPFSNRVSKAGLTGLLRVTLAGPSIAFQSKTGQLHRKPAVYSIEAFPNPLQDKVRLRFFSQQNKTAILSMHDQAGRVLQQKRIRVFAGLNTMVWDLGQYPAGTYFLMDDSKTIRQKLIKQ